MICPAPEKMRARARKVRGFRRCGPEPAVEIGGERHYPEFAGHVCAHPQGRKAQVVLQEQGEAGGLSPPVQGEEKEPGGEEQHRGSQKIPAILEEGGAHAPGQRQPHRGRDQQQHPGAEQF